MNEPSTKDLREGFDAFAEDMAEHQRSIGKEPTPIANQDLAAAEFEKLEKQGTFARPAEPTNEVDLDRQAFEKKKVNGREYQVTKDAGNGAVAELGTFQQQQTMRILRRLLLLLTLEDSGIGGAPSWKARTVKVLDKCGATMGAVTKEQHAKFDRELDELLEDSNRLFGDWRVDPEPKIIVGA